MTSNKKIVQNDPPQEKIKFILELFNSSKLTDAEKEIKKELIVYPKSPILFNILGAVFAGQNELQKALTSYKKSISISPHYTQAYNNLGACMYKLGKITEAIQSYQKAIEIQPDHADAHNNLGIVFKESGENEKSIKCYQKAIEIQPDHADAHNNLGISFKELSEHKKSIYHYEKTIEINPNSPIAYSNLGNAYRWSGEYQKAISCHQKAIQIDPKYADAHYNLGTVFDGLNEFEQATDFYTKAVEIQPNHPSANANLLFTTCWSNNNNKYLKIAKKYYETITRYDEKELINYKAPIQKNMKVGFISGDFRNHSVIFFLLDTLKYLKEREIKLFAYSNNFKEDNFTKLIKQYFDNWNLVVHKTDKNLINLIRKDSLDILFDLSGHTANNRLAVFKNRCAPVQVSWCGWLASTGVKEMDYIIGDKYVTPLSDQNKFTEKIYHMKKIWQCYSTSESLSKLVAIKKNNEKYVIFGSFVNNMKINENVINTWSKILKALPNSKLFLKCTSFSIPQAQENFIRKINNKINKNQLIIEGKSSRLEYLDCYNKIDIVLDTFPSSGATTSFEASYMGVPILTKTNEGNFGFRAGESINRNLNMNEWIAKNEIEYVEKAVKFSKNKSYLTNLKIELGNLARKSPLFDSKNYSNDFYEMLLNIR